EVQHGRTSRSNLQAQEQRDYRNLLGEDYLSVDVTLGVILGARQSAQSTVTGQVKLFVDPTSVVLTTPTGKRLFWVVVTGHGFFHRTRNLGGQVQGAARFYTGQP